MHRLTASFLFFLCSFCTSDIIQTPKEECTAGAECNLTCNHEFFTTNYYTHWYRMIPGQGLAFLISDFKSTAPDLQVSKFRLSFSNDRKSSVLYIQKVNPEDSAVYLCAQAEGNNVKLTFGSGTKLTVTPKTDRTMPLVYQLTSYKPKEGLPDTVCLVTDFPSPNKTLDVDEQIIKLEDKAVLDKSSRDVWRYSAVIWGEDNPSKNLNCIVKYDGETVLPEMTIEETTDTCSSLTVTGRFHTNPGMNTLSISVLGLRILTAKAIVFNLIITLRLWSS